MTMHDALCALVYCMTTTGAKYLGSLTDKSERDPFVKSLKRCVDFVQGEINLNLKICKRCEEKAEGMQKANDFCAGCRAKIRSEQCEA